VLKLGQKFIIKHVLHKGIPDDLFKNLAADCSKTDWTIIIDISSATFFEQRRDISILPSRW
jgi:hypothetical protein